MVVDRLQMVSLVVFLFVAALLQRTNVTILRRGRGAGHGSWPGLRGNCLS